MQNSQLTKTFKKGYYKSNSQASHNCHENFVVFHEQGDKL